MDKYAVRKLQEEKDSANPIKRDKHERISAEIIKIFAENKCTATEAYNILRNIQKGIDAAEAIQETGIGEDVMAFLNR